MSFVLLSAKGDRRFRLPNGEELVVGREPLSDLPILDAGVSRRHAEVRADDDGVALRDLGSRNGTWLNGRRISTARASAGDLVAFGPIVLRVQRESDTPLSSASQPTPKNASASMILERAMPRRGVTAEGIASRRLEQLVAIAQRLGGMSSLPTLLDQIVDDLFDTLRADRVAVLLRDTDGAMQMHVARDRDGTPVSRPVPRAISDGVADRQMALLTHDARDDSRTAGMSVVQQAIRSALAAPLISNDGRTLGVLYVDNLRDVEAFTDDDLDFLVAYAGIAAAGVEREQVMENLREAGRVRENFERYFTPQIAERIAAQTGSVVPGGDRRTVAVLFCDVRGFTAIAESLPPDQMADQLNEYFGVMVDCVFRHQGALDKFIGDAILAYWGAPIAASDDIERSVQAACDMQRALEQLNAAWDAAGRPMLHSGIGIHVGDAFVGNIGSPRRLEYTLIGNTVNLANRIRERARGEEILVSGSIRDALADTDIGARLQPRPELATRTAGPSPELFAVDWRE